ncbi:hypothetical protein B0H17DRAFT_1137951 [Mycena rosella]|uniref:Uncharacterized protein n=1 Tax=Mycena rosella TaxID=1033263 RepID=A0AAD7DAT0_MYCRO|nr:hypothetical protein B0H17DRAFT_1137951 [Mycena rosella]
MNWRQAVNFIHGVMLVHDNIIIVVRVRDAGERIRDQVRTLIRSENKRQSQKDADVPGLARKNEGGKREHAARSAARIDQPEGTGNEERRRKDATGGTQGRYTVATSPQAKKDLYMREVSGKDADDVGNNIEARARKRLKQERESHQVRMGESPRHFAHERRRSSNAE